MGEIRNLPCKLNDTEVRLKGEEIAELVIRATGLEDQRKTEAKELADEIKGLGERIRKLAREVRAHEEEREVEVEFRPDYGRHAMDTVRMDTGEVISTRALTEEDRQADLFKAQVDSDLNKLGAGEPDPDQAEIDSTLEQLGAEPPIAEEPYTDLADVQGPAPEAKSEAEAKPENGKTKKSRKRKTDEEADDWPAEGTGLPAS